MKPMAKPKTRVCLECNTEFETIGKRKLCSTKCASDRNKRKSKIKHRQNYVPRQHHPRYCMICSKKFTPTSGTQRYCSQECGFEANRVRARDYYYQPKQKKVEKHCQECGAMFMPARSSMIYCSSECNQKVQDRKRGRKVDSKLTNCLICDIEFTPPRYGQKYCSESCAHVAKLEHTRAWMKRERDYDDDYEISYRFVWDDGSNDNYWLDNLEWLLNQGKLNRAAMMLPPIGPMPEWASRPLEQPEEEPDQPAGQVASEGRVMTPRELLALGVGKNSQLARWMCTIPRGMLIGAGGSIHWKSKFTGNRRQSIDVSEDG